MRLYDPFPLEKLPPRVRRVILAKFGGRCPSVRDVVSIPDADWLKLRGMGAKSLGRLWSVAQNVQRNARISPLAGMTEAELQAGRIQTVVATHILLPSRSHSSSTSAGVLQPSAFLGLALRAAATAAISSALCTLRSVPFGKY
jgi:hypothetical protein